MTTNADRRSVVDRIRRENEDEFGEKPRAAVQKLLSAGLPHPWMYVYELTQNALDAGARRVCWRSEGDAVMFQHDGRLALDESHVRGLSSLGASTKGLATVGFMGVGFKSVFARFREASVSDIDWRFRFAVRVRRGNLKSEVPEWFDTLCPHWDDEVPAPDAGYTTAFFLGLPADRQRPVADDLERLASTENRATLAVLARRGLTQVSVDDVVWDLSVDDDIVTVRRSRSDARWRWKAFVSRYRPDDDAMRRFLEVRQETDDQVDEGGRRVEREVVGLLPLDDNGLPQPADRGCVYATLPTQVRIPFGFHLQADWFVNVDRQNLREVTGDAWQEAIVGQVPEIVRQLLIWLSGESDAVRKRGYRALCEPDDDGGLLAGPLRNLRDDLARTLADQPIVPVHGPGPRRFCTPEQAAVLPKPFDGDFGSPWRPDLLFGPTVMDEHLLGKSTRDFAIWLEWGSLIGEDDVAWTDTLVACASGRRPSGRPLRTLARRRRERVGRRTGRAGEGGQMGTCPRDYLGERGAAEWTRAGRDRGRGSVGRFPAESCPATAVRHPCSSGQRPRRRRCQMAEGTAQEREARRFDSPGSGRPRRASARRPPGVGATPRQQSAGLGAGGLDGRRPSRAVGCTRGGSSRTRQQEPTSPLQATCFGRGLFRHR